MADQGPHLENPDPQGTVVPLRAPRRRVPGLWLHVAHLTDDTPALVVSTEDDRVYLFPQEILSPAGDLLSADPASLVQAGLGVDITMFFDPGRAAALSQAIAICRARRHASGTKP